MIELNVLSLCDGMSCGQIALKELGMFVKNYYASEVDKFAMRQTKHNFPNTVQLGDMVFLRYAMTWKDEVAEKFYKSEWISKKVKDRFKKLRDMDWKSINLVIGGTPCQGFSFAGKQLAFNDPRSKLFFDFIKILNHIKKLNPNVKFLLENVNMKKIFLDVISEYCGVYSVIINSRLVSAQNRDRFYWTNIQTRSEGIFYQEVYVDIPQPKDEGILLRDILEPEVDEKYYLSDKMVNTLSNRKDNVTNFNPCEFTVFDTNSDEKSRTINSRVYKMGDADNYIKVNKQGEPKSNQDKASCFTAGGNSGGNHSDMDLICVAMRGRNPDNPTSRIAGLPTEQRLEANISGKTNCLTSVSKDNLVMQLGRGKNKGGYHKEKTPTLSANSWEQNNLVLVGNIYDNGQNSQGGRVYDSNAKACILNGSAGGGGTKTGLYAVSSSNTAIQLNQSTESGGKQPYQHNRIYSDEGKMICLDTDKRKNVYTDFRIRRLTPKECARLQTIPDWYDWVVSDTQIYKMCGNGWTVKVIMWILSFMEEKA